MKETYTRAEVKRMLESLEHLIRTRDASFYADANTVVYGDGGMDADGLLMKWKEDGD